MSCAWSDDHFPSVTEKNVERFTTMVSRSTGYFLGDVLLIFVQLLRGTRPHLWQGRLIHHAVQTRINLELFRHHPLNGMFY